MGERECMYSVCKVCVVCFYVECVFERVSMCLYMICMYVCMYVLTI